jgi:hypothetical protein
VTAASGTAGDNQHECAACRRLVDAERNYFSLLIRETYHHPGMLSSLCESRGFCPVHTRAFLAAVKSSRIPTFVYEHVIDATLFYLRRAVGPRVDCHACIGSREVVARLLQRRNDTTPTLCFDHGSSVGLDAFRRASALTVEEPDAVRRADLLRSSAPAAIDAMPTLDVLSERLAIGVCPLCAAMGHAEARLIGSAGREMTDPGSQPWCGAHLRDLAALDPERARGVEHDMHAGSETGCVVCASVSAEEQRQVELLLVALRDPAICRRYEDGTGLCFRHVEAVGVPWPAIVREMLAAQLAILQWELEEAERKLSWQGRYERPGPESNAWLRAPVQLDGRVSLGRPSSVLEREGMSCELGHAV